MIRKTFGIYDQQNALCRCYLEIGRSHLACWTKTDNGGHIHDFEFFEFEQVGEDNLAETLQKVSLHSKLMDGKYQRFYVIWENDQCLLVPDRFADPELKSSYLNRLFGERLESAEETHKLSSASVFYRVPASWKKAILDRYPYAIFTHKFKSLFSRAEQTGKPGVNQPPRHFHLVFYPNHFLMTLVKDETPQLLQSFSFETADDVIYHILNVAERFQVNIGATDVYVSGLVDLDSDLYKELYKYVQELRPATLEQDNMTAPEFADYPAHYFSTYYFTET